MSGKKKVICEPPACCTQFFVVKFEVLVVPKRESQNMGFCVVLLRHFCGHFAFISVDLLQTISSLFASFRQG